MSRAVPEQARGSSRPSWSVRFARDAELATRAEPTHSGDCERANDRLWSGLHPDGIAAIYGEHPAASRGRDRAQPLRDPRRTRSAARGPAACTGPSTRRSSAYQDAAERRRQLAAEVGELAGELIDVRSSPRDGPSTTLSEANIPSLIWAGG